MLLDSASEFWIASQGRSMVGGWRAMPPRQSRLPLTPGKFAPEPAGERESIWTSEILICPL